MLASVLNGGDDSGFRFCNQHKSPVGAAAGCDLLILILKKQDQKIAAFGSSYTGDW
jgi:hypothetical protein